MRSVLKTKGNLNLIVPAVITLSLAAIILVFSLTMLNDLKDNTTDNTPAHDAANYTIEGMGKFADYWDLIVLAIVITVIISLLMVVFATRRVQ